MISYLVCDKFIADREAGSEILIKTKNVANQKVNVTNPLNIENKVIPFANQKFQDG